ncbi:MAG: RNA pseudouridine synthase [Chitinophagales bacterium]|nr:RNA pseudouridine synthase [Chitinophagales bacterium]
MNSLDSQVGLTTVDSCFIPLELSSPLPLPEKMDYPFCYEPKDIALKAAELLQATIHRDLEPHHEFGLYESTGIGKMFGVLVVKNHQDQLGYLAAFSGKLGDSNFYPGFVPPVFDTLNPNGFYKIGEQEVNVINRQIEVLQRNPERIQALDILEKTQKRAAADILDLKNQIKAQKEIRKQARIAAEAAFSGLELEEKLAYLNTESIKWHYSLKERQRLWKETIAQLQQKVDQFDEEIDALKLKRRQYSAALQKRLFESYAFLNQHGQYKDLIDIFHIHDDQTPPSGAGECAAPKLFQHAFLHGYQPIAMAEFWWGKSPTSEIRKHRHFYPACNGKCKPILEHMLEDIPIDDNPMLINPALGKSFSVVYEDDYLMVINKPEEFLSVPGKNIMDSVYTRIRNMYLHATGPLIVHRLDMSTSGLLLIAKSKEIHQHLQRQFIQRKVKKRYVAILKGEHLFTEKSGYIDLPLRVDLDDRPRQLVCNQYGKPAQTAWEWIHSKGDEHRLYLYPLTGRTHQLRVHVSHPLGLNLPIKGDDLYGERLDRLYLHAEMLEFMHPITKEVLVVEAAPNF